MKLKIFSDLQYLPQGINPVSILQPFWLTQQTDELSPWDNSMKQYTGIYDSLFEMTSLAQADIAVLPFDWFNVVGGTWTAKTNYNAQKLGMEFARVVKQAQKPLVIFYSGDRSHEKLPIRDAVVFRQSLLASQQQPQDFAMTAVYEDLVHHYLKGKVVVQQKREKPVVGFVGCVNQGSWQTNIKDFIYQGIMLLQGGTSFYPYEGHRIRNQALRYLQESSDVTTNFIVHNNMVFFDAVTPEEKLKVRWEYVDNMVKSDYILCCRGRGNFSIRLFETLCCGRIPIMVNTDCILPYESQIDWKKYCVWVERDDLSEIANKVAEFHNNLSSQDFMSLQSECRQLWERYLSSEGFLTNLYKHFEVKPSQNVNFCSPQLA